MQRIERVIDLRREKRASADVHFCACRLESSHSACLGRWMVVSVFKSFGKPVEAQMQRRLELPQEQALSKDSTRA